MHHQKHNGTLLEYYGTAGFNSLHRVISKMSIEFSDRYNAMYGAKDVAALQLTDADVENATAEQQLSLSIMLAACIINR